MSAIKSILVHLDSSPPCAARLRLAHQLAQANDCTATVLFAATPAQLQVPFGAGPEFSLTPMLEEFEVTRRKQARALFDSALAQGMTRLAWTELGREDPLGAFSRRALFADLVVLGQRQPRSATLPDVPADFVESVLIDSGRPGLLVPYIGIPQTLARTVLVAWKPTRESARALTAALPLLRGADQVHVAIWNDAGLSAADSAAPLEAHLKRHGLAATIHRYGDAPREVGEHLLSAASDLGADLLVMGCYGHARAREWVLGGASRTVLESMTLPVLMVH